MSARALLAELDTVGITITRDGDNLKVRAASGVDLAPYVARIRAHKPALLAELLIVRIIAVVTVPPAHFDRFTYESLLSEWHIRNPEERP